MVRDRYVARSKIGYIFGFVGFALILIWLSGCAATRGHAKALKLEAPPVAGFDIERERFTTFDGAELGLTVWEAETAEDPEYVVVGVHGMNDYAQAFEYAGPYWAARGVTTYAYDQRGFGRSEARGLWPKEELMREDLRAAVKLAREKHPDAVLSVVGISMGAAVAMTAFGSDNPPANVDRVILSGPGLRGWGGLPFMHRASLWASTKTIIPESFMRRTAPTLAPHVRTVYYENGYHMLMRDLQHETVLEDQLAFMRAPSEALPSGAPPIPWASGGSES